MVRPEAEAHAEEVKGQCAEACCGNPADESSAQVSAEAPGSRLPAKRRDLPVEAERQKPSERRREQERGPQHEVKSAASTYLQRGSRDAHFTAKAMTCSQEFGGESGRGSSGVEGEARAQGLLRNRRGPSAQPMSRKDDSYKPQAKSSVVQRESEGNVVLKMGTTNNVSGGKVPCGESAGRGGKREGMSGRGAGPTSPAGNQPVDKVRQLQRRLWKVAKRQPERRFHALYDRICRGDVLWEAWKRVRNRRGVAGVDAETIAMIEQRGVEKLMEELQTKLRAGTYQPRAVLRRYIPKSDGKKRPLGIPAVRDRVVQMAARLVIEPIFEAGFRASSYGYRPRRSATDALETLRKQATRGGDYVLEADIVDYFGSIDHELLMQLMRKRVTDRRVLKLVRQWLEAGVMEDGQRSETTIGTPQGGVISPLLSNIYLHELDTAWERECAHLGTLVRYADDFVVMCDTAEACEEAALRVNQILTRLGLKLHPEKTRRVELTGGKDSFDFLGCHLQKRVSGRLLERGVRRYYLHRWPSARSMKRIRHRVKELTSPRRNGVRDVGELILDLNPVLRGWGSYFRTGNAANKFHVIDNYVIKRLWLFLRRRHGRHWTTQRARRWSRDFFHQDLGLHRLRGTIRYPEAA